MKILLKTGSLDNAVQVFSLAQPSWDMDIIPRSTNMVSVCVIVCFVDIFILI